MAEFDANRIWPLAHFATWSARWERRLGAPMSDDFWAIWNERRTRTLCTFAVSPDLLEVGNGQTARHSGVNELQREDNSSGRACAGYRDFSSCLKQKKPRGSGNIRGFYRDPDAPARSR
jgi:hypothetical protein